MYRTRKRPNITAAVMWAGVMAAVMSAGCRSFDGEKVRQEHAESYAQGLAQTSAQVLSEHGPLGLADCIGLAMEHSLPSRRVEIQQRIAKLERKIAFANFLPAVSVGYQHYELDPAINVELPEDATLNIGRVRSLMWEANVSIFNPATWFLYAMHQRGEEIAGLVGDYTRQMTALQVTLLYYHCLSLAEMDRALESALAAAVELQKQVQALCGEGLVSAWQADQAAVLVAARRIERQRTERALTQARAELSAAMGLSPLAEMALKQEMPLAPPEGTVEDVIVEALLCHPQLRIADRQIEIEKEKVKIALTNFLPKLFGFVYHPDTLDDVVGTTNMWVYGLSGTMSLFNGFANVNEYKAARKHREQSFLEREQASLTVMLEVIRARLAVVTAQEEAALAGQAAAVAAKRWADAEQKWREGLINSAEMLGITAERDKADMQAINTRFQYQVSTATLLNVMGKTRIDYEELQHDGES